VSARRPGRIAAILATVVVSVAAAAVYGCGDDEVSGTAVADAIPAEAIIFGQAVVRPEGEDRERIESLLGPLLDDATLEERADELLAAEEAGITYTDDIEPWLGEHAALWITDFGADDAVEPEGDDGDETFGYAVEVTDEDEALAFIEKAAEDSEVEFEQASYEGVDYMLGDGQGIAVTEGLLVGGTEAGLEASVDALAGEGLADEPELEEDAAAALELADGTVAAFYLDLAEVFALAEEQGELSADDRALIEQLAPDFTAEPVTGALSLGDQSIALEFGFGSFPAALGSLTESPLLAEMPAESLAVLGAADLGESYSRLLELVAEFPELSGGRSLEGVYRGFERQAGFPLQDLLDSIGDAALFVRGSSPFDLDGAAVIETLDPATTETLLARLRALLVRDGSVEVGPPGVAADAGLSISSSDLPQAVEIAQRDDRVVIGYGTAAVEEAFEPAQTLDASDSFAGAREAVGDDLAVGAFVDLAGAVDLASLGAAFSPELSSALPYLERFTYLVYGAGDDGERTRYRVAVGIE